MADWLRTAKRLFRAQPQPREQNYDFDCPCGQHFTGPRLTLPQALPCPECGRTHFILPLSPYPVPQPLKAPRPPLLGRRPTSPAPPATPAPREAPTRRRSPREEEPTPVEFPPEETATSDTAKHRQPETPRDRSAAGPPPQPRSPPLPLRGPSPSAPHAAGASPPPVKPVRASGDQTAHRPPPTRRPGPTWWTPVRKAMVATIVTLSVCGWWFQRAHRRSVAEQTLGPRARQAAEALSRGDLEEAANCYVDVVEAIELLNRKEPRSLQLRQIGRETIARARLCSSPLQTLAEEASAFSRGTSTSWKETFRSQFQDHWVVLDLTVEPRTGDSRRGRYGLDCLLTAEGVELLLVGELPEFERLPLSAETPRRVIFAAPLAGLQPGDASHPGQWTLKLAGRQGFLWTSPETLAELGFPVDDETRAVLQSQAALLGVVTP